MTINIFCDGGARGNPGPSACAFVVYTQKLAPKFLSAEILQYKCGKYLGVGTNNQAEYKAVVAAWQWLDGYLASQPRLGASRATVNFHLDSNLVVSQLTGRFKVKDADLKVLRNEIARIERKVTVGSSLAVSYRYVPRSQNMMADLVVNETLDDKTWP